MHCALAVGLEEATACQLLVAMPSAATSQTGPLVSALSFPRPVIALDAISRTSTGGVLLSCRIKTFPKIFYFWVLIPVDNSIGSEEGEEYLFYLLIVYNYFGGQLYPAKFLLLDGIFVFLLDNYS